MVKKEIKRQLKLLTVYMATTIYAAFKGLSVGLWIVITIKLFEATMNVRLEEQATILYFIGSMITSTIYFWYTMTRKVEKGEEK